MTESPRYVYDCRRARDFGWVSFKTPEEAQRAIQSSKDGTALLLLSLLLWMDKGPMGLTCLSVCVMYSHMDCET